MEVVPADIELNAAFLCLLVLLHAPLDAARPASLDGCDSLARSSANSASPFARSSATSASILMCCCSTASSTPQALVSIHSIAVFSKGRISRRKAVTVSSLDCIC
jgi:hypothetical protein